MSGNRACPHRVARWYIIHRSVAVDSQAERMQVRGSWTNETVDIATTMRPPALLSSSQARKVNRLSIHALDYAMVFDPYALFRRTAFLVEPYPHVVPFLRHPPF